MKEKRKSQGCGIKQFLEDSKAENEALKKLIAALQEEEMKKRAMKSNSGGLSQLNAI